MAEESERDGKDLEQALQMVETVLNLHVETKSAVSNNYNAYLGLSAANKHIPR
jgi:predicted RNase H-like HicB family nuclease